ncbi:MAG: EAL domain-containing protein [Alphaproteobacteria bacterium]|nr:EAL domain-containing protein [Alphaproteobacteria bacterium]
MSTISATEAQLRAERDRFVAFAFCGNDMLVELDQAGAVRLALGATQFLTGREMQELAGVTFADLFVVEDRANVADMVVTALESGRRFENVRAAFQATTRLPVRVEMTGFVMPKLNGRCLVAVRRARMASAAAKSADAVEPAAADSDDTIATVRTVITERDFEIAFQPVVSLESRGIHHMEALLRMRPTLDMSTFKFIQIAERNGLIAEMDLAMCEMTVRRLLEVAEKGRPCTVAVNVSGTSIETPNFAKRLDVVLNFRKMLNRLVIIEITDSGAIRNLRAANDFVQNLRIQGFKVTLDDFGARGAAFEQLRHIDIDFVKIDGTFIRESRRNERGKVFVMAMASLCKQLGVTAIAEQVEDPDSVAFLRECGIPYGQGFVFGKPMLDPDLLVGESMSDVRWRRDSAAIKSYVAVRRGG